MISAGLVLADYALGDLHLDQTDLAIRSSGSERIAEIVETLGTDCSISSLHI